MVRRVVGLLGIVLWVRFLGCASHPPHGPAARAAAPQPTVGFPRVTIQSSNNFADERDTSSLELSADGSFTTEHVMSDGGSTSTVTVCGGALPASQAAAWVARIRSQATLKAPPRGPSREAIEREKIPYTYEVSYSATAGEALFFDPETSRHDLDKLFEELRPLSRYSTSKR